jgi:hypothetical protein
MKISAKIMLAFAAVIPAAASASAVIAVHRDPGCTCCEQWAKQVKAQLGRDVRVLDDANRTAFDDHLGVPKDRRSCHTAIIDGLAFEGHVPIADVKRLLATRPKGVVGLAVAGMPAGSPGMEMPGVPAQTFDVIAFGPAGQRIYAHHG